MERKRIQKLLSEFGICSRRRAETLIKENKVKVNGKTAKLGDKANFKDLIGVEKCFLIFVFTKILNFHMHPIKFFSKQTLGV